MKIRFMLSFAIVLSLFLIGATLFLPITLLAQSRNAIPFWYLRDAGGTLWRIAIADERRKDVNDWAPVAGEPAKQNAPFSPAAGLNALKVLLSKQIFNANTALINDIPRNGRIDTVLTVSFEDGGQKEVSVDYPNFAATIRYIIGFDEDDNTPAYFTRVSDELNKIATEQDNQQVKRDPLLFVPDESLDRIEIINAGLDNKRWLHVYHLQAKYKRKFKKNIYAAVYMTQDNINRFEVIFATQ